MPREPYRNIPWMTDELRDFAGANFDGLVQQGVDQTQAQPQAIPTQQQAYGQYQKALTDQLLEYQRLFGDMQKQQREQRAWETAERDKAKPFIPDDIMRIADRFIQNQVATLPGKYATTGGVMTRSLPNLDPVLRSMAQGSQADEQARQQRKAELEQRIQRRRFDSDRDMQQLMQFAQLKGGVNEKLAAAAMQAEQMQQQREWQQKQFDQTVKQNDRMYALQKGQLDATIAKFNYDKALTTKKIATDYGDDVAKQYVAIRDKMGTDSTYKAMQTIANDSKVAMDQMIQAAQDQDPAQMSAALAALLKSYSGAAASDAEAARVVGGNISQIQQFLNKFETEYAGGMPPPDVINGYLKSMVSRINSANQRIEQISKYYKQTFNTYVLGQAANYGQPIDLGRLDEQWTLNPSIVEPTVFDPKAITEAITSMPKITDTMKPKTPDATVTPAETDPSATGPVMVPKDDNRSISDMIRGMF